MNPEKNIPTVLIILGATGDLMGRKIAPALFHLSVDGNLPSRFEVIGFARRELSDDSFRDHISEKLGSHKRQKIRHLAPFLKRFTYQQGRFEDKKAYTELARKLQEVDDRWGVCSNKLFYLAVPPEFYATITNHLHDSGLTEPCSPEEGWTRVLIEKPFGEDFKTARKLDELLSRLFREVQIYRIDHYLAKEMLQNILTFRFSNTLFESIWDRDSIERIDIRLLESIGVEKRGKFYDGLGTLRDVGQNHLLQMLALITMEHPGTFDADEIRFKRAEILKTLRPLSKKEIQSQTFRGQYEGYRSIDGVAPRSMTETYFKIGGSFMTSPKWQGVPITLEAGKRIGEQRKEIVVTFRHPTPCLCPRGANHYKNQITFALEPDEGIDVRFWSKKPGLNFDIEERNLHFLLRKTGRRVQYVEEYEKLLLDCITGDQTLFMSTDEIKAMWAFTDPIVEAWQRGAVPLARYKPGESSVLEEAKKVDQVLALAAEQKQAAYPKRKAIGIVGLGRMGSNLARQLNRKGWRVVGMDKNRAALEALEKEGIETVASLKALAEHLEKPRLIWLMVPAGRAVESTLFGKSGLARLLSKNDTVIDGGNSFFKDSVARHKKLAREDVRFIDVGVSGGPEGALAGASLMVGGDRNLFRKLEGLFADIAHEDGYDFFEGAGAGHFVKMIHNGIEYGMMQAIAEGFTVLKKSSYSLDLKEIAEVYNSGSVIESRLIGWLTDAFELHGENLDGVSGSVGHSGEGKWTVETAKAMGLKAKIIEESLKFRVASAGKPSYTGRILSALREQFGGHSVQSPKKKK